MALSYIDLGKDCCDANLNDVIAYQQAINEYCSEVDVQTLEIITVKLEKSTESTLISQVKQEYDDLLPVWKGGAGSLEDAFGLHRHLQL